MHSQVLLSTMHVHVCTLVNISVHICFTLATRCAYVLCIHMCICIRVCTYICVCMYIYIYVCISIRIYAYVYGCVYVCVCMYMYIYVCICMCLYICICLYTACMCSLFHLTLGNEDGGFQLVYESACCLAWGIVLTEGKIGVFSVSSLSLTRVGVYVGVCVCIRTHTHTLHRWGYSDVSTGVGMRHLEGPKNPDGLNLGISSEKEKQKM